MFSSLYVNTVKIGENTGRLDEAFLRLSEYLDRDRCSLDHLERRRTGLLHRTEGEGDAPDIQEPIARDGTHDLGTQWMPRERITEAVGQGGREVATQHHFVPGILAEPGCGECSGERDLRVGEEHRELGGCESLASRAAGAQLLVIREEFEGSIEKSLALEIADHALMNGDEVRRSSSRVPEHDVLRVVVVEHLLADDVCHLGEERVSVSHPRNAFRNGRASWNSPGVKASRRESIIGRRP